MEPGEAIQDQEQEKLSRTNGTQGKIWYFIITGATGAEPSERPARRWPTSLLPRGHRYGRRGHQVLRVLWRRQGYGVQVNVKGETQREIERHRQREAVRKKEKIIERGIKRQGEREIERYRERGMKRQIQKSENRKEKEKKNTSRTCSI